MKAKRKVSGNRKKTNPPSAQTPEVPGAPGHFLNRDLSWLHFNRRVLLEAQDPRTPLLERVRFLTIFSSNLDEFVMKRIGRIKRLVSGAASSRSLDGRLVHEQLAEIRNTILADTQLQNGIYHALLPELSKAGINFLSYEDLSPGEKAFCDDYFQRALFPILTPLSVDPGHPFPFISNLSFSLGVILKTPQKSPQDQNTIFSRVKIPLTASSWLRLTGGAKEEKLVRVTSIIRNNLSALYPGMEIVEITPFRVTRNADIDHRDAGEDEAEDMLIQVAEGLKERRLAECVRLEIYQDCDPHMRTFLKDSLEIQDDDIYPVDYPMDYSSLKSIVDLDLPQLKYKPWVPQTPRPFQDDGNVFGIIKQSDLLVHHPYDNFTTTVERLVSQAADDPHVQAIKMTLYRTGPNSPFIRSLIRAAENGKQVVCLIELKARFDEQQNIIWAHKLEDAGVHVVYGMPGLKIHAKATLIVRQEADGELVSYAHIATGNYNVMTSHIYTDLGLMTCRPPITREIMEIFNYLTGSSLKTHYEKLLVAPINMKARLLAKIDEEISFAATTGHGLIVAKMNSLEDSALTEALYRASQAGVDIVLFVRGFCSLRPGVSGLSERIKVISVIGRFLEHSRFFYFSRGKKTPQDGEFWIGSADWMHRNMHQRVEIVCPVEDPRLKESLWELYQILLNDNRQAWDLQSDGSYRQRNPALGESERGTHEVLMGLTFQKNKIPEETNS